MNKHKKYSLIFLFSLVTIFISIALVNYITDPWGIFNTSELKTITASSNRMDKVLGVLQKKPDSICLGSSRVRDGIPENNQSWSKISQRPLNLGISNGSIFEMYKLLVHSQNTGKLKSVIIGLDFFSFSSAIKNNLHSVEHMLLSKDNSEAMIKARLAFSFDMAKASLSVTKAEKEKTGPAKNSPKLIDFRKRFLNTARHYSKNVYKNFSSESNSYRPLDYFEKILSFSNENKIDVYIYISPIHAWLTKTIELCGLWGEYENWKRDLVKVCAQYGHEIYDFSTLNPVTTEKVPEKKTVSMMKFYKECSHFTLESGHIVLDTLLTGKELKEGFGIKVNNQNIEFYLKKTKNDLKRYTQLNSEDINLIQNTIN